MACEGGGGREILIRENIGLHDSPGVGAKNLHWSESVQYYHDYVVVIVIVAWQDVEVEHFLLLNINNSLHVLTEDAAGLPHTPLWHVCPLQLINVVLKEHQRRRSEDNTKRCGLKDEGLVWKLLVSHCLGRIQLLKTVGIANLYPALWRDALWLYDRDLQVVT